MLITFFQNYIFSFENSVIPDPYPDQQKPAMKPADQDPRGIFIYDFPLYRMNIEVH